MNINAGELCKLTREEVQVFNREPLVDGFASDPPPVRADSTRVLPMVNKVLRMMHGYFVSTCYYYYTLTPGIREYRLREQNDGTQPGNDAFGFVTDAHIQDPDTERWYPLDPSSTEKEYYYNPYRDNQQGQRRPFAIYLEGDRMGFDFIPQKPYVVRLLADYIPPDMVLRTDLPGRLPHALHEGLVMGSAVELARKALALPVPQPAFADGRILRYREIKSQYEGYWIPRAKELSNARIVSQSNSPLLNAYNMQGWYVGVRSL